MDKGTLIYCFQGKTNRDLNPQVALTIANIVGNKFKDEGHKKVLIGEDHLLKKL